MEKEERPKASANKNASEINEKANRADSVLLHPLFTNRVLLPTPAVDEVFKAVISTIVLRDTGCCLSGRSGVGKSCALELMESALHERMPRLCIFRHDIHNHQIPSIRAFFKHFLSTVQHAEKKGETYDLRERLINILVDDARISGMGMVLLFIDEAHAMLIQDFDFLKDVYNDLNKQGIQLITVLMGQEPDLDATIERLKNARRLDLIGRFAMRVVPFRAYNSVNDLSVILKGIDSTRHPDENGPTWTEFFFPQAYQRGFRLENEAENFMAAIRAVGAGNASGSFDFPARQTFLSIRKFVIENMRLDHSNMQLPEDVWRKAVEYAKLKNAMQLMEARRGGKSTELEF